MESRAALVGALLAILSADVESACVAMSGPAGIGASRKGRPYPSGVSQVCAGIVHFPGCVETRWEGLLKLKGRPQCMVPFPALRACTPTSALTPSALSPPAGDDASR